VNVGVQVDREVDHAIIVLSGVFDLIWHTQRKSFMRFRAPSHVWMVAIPPTSAWRKSIESTGPAQSCWRGCSID